MKRAAFIIFSFFIMFSIVRAEDDPITRLKNEIMLYFKPMTGTITSVDGHKVIMKIETKDLVKPGMRLKVLREGSPFIHPVTKELLGMVESTTGKVEIKESGTESSAGIIVEGEAREGEFCEMKMQPSHERSLRSMGDVCNYSARPRLRRRSSSQVAKSAGG